MTVSEAMNPEDEFYGEQRLLDVLTEVDGHAPGEIAARVLADVREFSAGARQSDDITVVAAQYAP